MKLVEERFCFADSLYGEHPNLIYRLAHEFAGETDVISITQSLKEALLYNTEAEAQAVLNAQPEWVKRDFYIRKVCLYYGAPTFNTKLLEQEN